jgi:hypothetical protein
MKRTENNKKLYINKLTTWFVAKNNNWIKTNAAKQNGNMNIEYPFIRVLIRKIE